MPIATTDLRSQWLSYIYRLGARGDKIDPAQAMRVQLFWRALEDHLGDTVAPPRATPKEDGSFSMFWDSGRHHFETEISSTGAVDWFYMDRESNRRSGGESLPWGYYPSEMIGALRLAMGGSQK